MAHSKRILRYRTDPDLGDKWRVTTAPLPLEMWEGFEPPDEIPADHPWNGNSTGILSPLYPRWNHPLASAGHDFRCEKAETTEQRKWADQKYQEEVGRTGWWITKKIGYAGVRIGSFFGVGVRYPHWTDKLKGESK